jgi:hypothetical protein
MISKWKTIQNTSIAAAFSTRHQEYVSLLFAIEASIRALNNSIDIVSISAQRIMCS